MKIYTVPNIWFITVKMTVLPPTVFNLNQTNYEVKAGVLLS